MQAGQVAQQTDQLLALGSLSQGMKAVLNLGVFQLTQVPVDFQDEFPEILGLIVDSQVPVQFRFLGQFPNLLLQDGQLGRVKGLALVVLVHQLLQPGNIAVAVSGGQRWNQVIDNGGMRPAFGLSALPRIVDDKRVKQGQVAQGNLRVASGR